MARGVKQSLLSASHSASHSPGLIPPSLTPSPSWGGSMQPSACEERVITEFDFTKAFASITSKTNHLFPLLSSCNLWPMTSPSKASCSTTFHCARAFCLEDDSFRYYLKIVSVFVVLRDFEVSIDGSSIDSVADNNETSCLQTNASWAWRRWSSPVPSDTFL